MKTVHVRLPQRTYPIFIGQQALGEFKDFVGSRHLGNHTVCITTSSIHALHRRTLTALLDGIGRTIVLVPEGERAKSFTWLVKVLRAIVSTDSLGRRIFITCLGGGVVGDLGGFAAAVYKRGIPYVQVPTTLLAQIDSSIGGKTAIDMDEAKNIVGSFHQPSAVFIDPLFLRTLPPKQLRQGLAEAIKYGVIGDKGLFRFLKENVADIRGLETAAISRVIETCAAMKAGIISRDEKEAKGLRTLLNFGHTFAHALESAGAYKAMAHGDAVAVGMCFAAYLSRRLGICDEKSVSELTDVIASYSLPLCARYDPQRVWRSLLHDKKFSGRKMRMVLLHGIGNVRVDDSIEPGLVRKAVYRFCSPH